jgi:hypothetical protein
MSIPFTTESDNRPFDVRSDARSTARNHTHRFEIMQELFDLRRDDEWIMAMRQKPRYVLIVENILIKQAQLSRTEHIREDSWAVDPEVCAANRGHLRRALAWFRERSMLRADGILPIIAVRLEMTFEEFLRQHGVGDDHGGNGHNGNGHNGHNGSGHSDAKNRRDRSAADEAYNARRRDRRAGISTDKRPAEPDLAPSEARRLTPSTPEPTPTVTPEVTPTTPADIDIESNRIESISNDSYKNIDSRFDSIRSVEDAPSPVPRLTDAPPPADVMQRMVKVCWGKLTAHRAKELYEHYGVQRCLDICESLPHWKPANPVKLLESAFKGGPERYPLHPAVIAEREEKAKGPPQTSFPRVSVVGPARSPDIETAEIPGTEDDVLETRRYRFLTHLPPARQAEIEAEIRRSMPDIHRSRWREGHPPPIAISAQVESLRAEILDRLMSEAQRRMA